MIDYTVKGGEEKKKHGCLSALIIFLLILVLFAGATYFFLPSLLSRSVSGGFIYRTLPEDARTGIDNMNRLVTENLAELEKSGLSREDARSVIESLDYKTFQAVIEDLGTSAVRDTSDIIDITARHIDLTGLDVPQLKREFQAPLQQETLREMTIRLKESPILMRSGFTLAREMLLQALEDSSIESSENPVSSTKKKK